MFCLSLPLGYYKYDTYCIHYQHFLHLVDIEHFLNVCHVPAAFRKPLVGEAQTRD